MQLIKTSTVIDETDQDSIVLEISYRFSMPSDVLAIKLANTINQLTVKALQQLQEEQDQPVQKVQGAP